MHGKTAKVFLAIDFSTLSALRLRFESVSTGTTRRPVCPTPATRLGALGGHYDLIGLGTRLGKYPNAQSQRAATSRKDRSIEEDISEPIPGRRQGHCLASSMLRAARQYSIRLHSKYGRLIIVLALMASVESLPFAKCIAHQGIPQQGNRIEIAHQKFGREPYPFGDCSKAVSSLHQ
jgi:hypothetical protein